MVTPDAPKPGPHLHQLPTLAELAEMHARHAHNLVTSLDDGLTWGERADAATAHAAVARACAHAAHAVRPAFHRVAK